MSIRPITYRAARPPSALTRRRLLGQAAAAGLLATPAAALLGACATGGDDGSDNSGGGGQERNAENPFGFVPDSRVDAVFFTGGFGTEYPNALKEEFERRWPQAEVGVVTTETIATEMQPRFAGGTPPDFLNNSGDDELAVDGLVNDGAIHPLTELLDAPSLDDPSRTVRDSLTAGVEAAGSFGGTVYSLNFVNSTYGIWYDAKLFRDNGWTPPTTWSEFLALADQMLAAGVAPFINGNSTGLWYLQNVLMEWVNLEGGHEAVIAIDNLEPDAWRAPAVMTAAQRLQELVDSGLVYPGMEGLTHIQAQQAWLDREAGMLWCGTWLEAEMSDEEVLAEHEVSGGIPEDFEMTLMPPWAPSDNPALTPGSVRNQPGEPFVIPTNGANRAGGLELLRVMLTQSFAERFIELTGSATVVQGSGLNVESVPLRSAIDVANNAPDALTWKWETWYNAKMYVDTLEPMLGELMAGRASAQDLVDAMQTAADEVRDDPSIEKFTREA
jgi:N-acetylglucosamine transport system substrate-binding protein